MKTVRITRQGFPNHGQHSWMRYFMFILSKKYNVLVDPVNPDLVIHSDLNYNAEQVDTFTKHLPTEYRSSSDKNKKFYKDWSKSFLKSNKYLIKKYKHEPLLEYHWRKDCLKYNFFNRKLTFLKSFFKLKNKWDW